MKLSIRFLLHSSVVIFTSNKQRNSGTFVAAANDDRYNEPRYSEPRNNHAGIVLDDEPPTDKCNVGHEFSDESRMFVPNTGNTCSCFYNILFKDSELQNEKNVDYAPTFNRNLERKLLMDIWKPPKSKSTGQVLRPAIVLVHGGHCKGGDKSNEEARAKQFASRGWVAASINYRLLSKADSCRTEGSIEAAGSDAKAAIRYLEANSIRLGIDTNRIAIMGCSAGGRTSMYASFVKGNGVEKRPGATQKNSHDYANYPAKISACVEVSADYYAPHESFPPQFPKDSPPLLIIHGKNDGNRMTKCSVAETNYRLALDAQIYVEKYILPNAGHCPFDRIDLQKVYSFLYKALSLDSIDCQCGGIVSLGKNKACRGDHSGDNTVSYYVEKYVPPNNIEECTALCQSGTCHGVEYNQSSGYCEIWKRRPLATQNVSGYQCFVKTKYPSGKLISFQGENKACRGINSDDNSPSHYSVHQVSPFSIEECTALCQVSNCKGVEYNQHTGRCEVWNRLPLTTKNVLGFECFVKTEPLVNLVSLHGENKACRGHHSDDNSNSYYFLKWVSPFNVEECTTLCQISGCYGVEYNQNTGRCEVWKRRPLATQNVSGYQCFVKEVPIFIPFQGENKACRGINSEDNSPSYYSVHQVSPFSIEECTGLCQGSSCKGVEYNQNTGRCEVWNRLPLTTKNVLGFECFRKEISGSTNHN